MKVRINCRIGCNPLGAYFFCFETLISDIYEQRIF